MTPEEKKQYNKDYYERTKNLQGRPGANPPPQKAPSPATKSVPATKPKIDPIKAAEARVSRLKSKVSSLTKALSEAEAALSQSRQAERKKAKASSDGKSTAKEKQDSQEFRDKHKEELKAKAKKASKTASSSGGSSSSSSSSNGISAMSAEQLGSRIIKIRSVLRDAKRQLSSATQQLGQLAHSAIVSDPKSNENFARFRSERIPSNDSSNRS